MSSLKERYSLRIYIDEKKTDLDTLLGIEDSLKVRIGYLGRSSVRLEDKGAIKQIIYIATKSIQEDLDKAIKEFNEL